MIPYSVASPFWSDTAEKDRYFALPNNTKIALTHEGDFLFPVGSVLMKHFKLNDRFIETRLFTRGELGWQGFSYEWRDDQIDAVLLTDAKKNWLKVFNGNTPVQTNASSVIPQQRIFHWV